VAHHDSAGGGGVIGPGDVQWMTAGSGILHKEYHEQKFAQKGGAFHMAQLWVNLPKAHKLAAPRYQPLLATQMGQVELPDQAGVIRVIAGEFRGVAGPALTYSPVNLFDGQLNQGGKVEFAFPAQQNAALLVIEGELVVNTTSRAHKDDFVLFENVGERVLLEAKSPTKLLVLNGEPLAEPIVQYGPFVMNTEHEIMQAIRDYNSGRFGHLEE